MAIAFVQNVAQAGVASPPNSSTQSFVTGSTAVAAGDFLVLTLAFNSSAAPSPVVSSVAGGGLTWSVDVQASTLSSGGGGIAICSAQAPSGMAGTTTVTVTFSAAAAKFSYSLDEFSGIAASSALDQTTSAHSGSNGTTWDSGATAATTQAAELVIGAGTHNATESTFTNGTGFTKLTASPLVTGASAKKALTAEYQIVSATGTQDATGTVNSSSAWAAAIATYLGATASPQTLILGFPASASAAFGPLLLPQAVTQSLGFPASASVVFGPLLLPRVVTQSLGFPSSPPTAYGINPKSITLLALGIAQSASHAFGPTLHPGSVTLVLGFPSSTSHAFGPVMVPGAVTLVLGFPSSAPHAFGPVLIPGVKTQTLGFPSSTSHAFGPTLVPGVVTQTLGFVLRNAQAFGANVVYANILPASPYFEPFNRIMVDQELNQIWVTLSRDQAIILGEGQSTNITGPTRNSIFLEEA